MDENKYCYLFLLLTLLRAYIEKLWGPGVQVVHPVLVGCQPETEALSLGGLGQLWPAHSGKAGILGGGLILQIPSHEL